MTKERGEREHGRTEDEQHASFDRQSTDVACLRAIAAACTAVAHWRPAGPLSSTHPQAPGHRHASQERPLVRQPARAAILARQPLPRRAPTATSCVNTSHMQARCCRRKSVPAGPLARRAPVTTQRRPQHRHVVDLSKARKRMRAHSRLRSTWCSERPSKLGSAGGGGGFALQRAAQ